MKTRGRIISIIDGKRVLVDIGENCGVTENKKYIGYSIREISAKEGNLAPTTRKLEIPKRKLRVESIQYDSSVLITDESIEIASPFMFNSGSINLFGYITKPRKIADENDGFTFSDGKTYEQISQENLQVGDYVKERSLI